MTLQAPRYPSGWTSRGVDPPRRRPRGRAAGRAPPSLRPRGGRAPPRTVAGGAGLLEAGPTGLGWPATWRGAGSPAWWLRLGSCRRGPATGVKTDPAARIDRMRDRHRLSKFLLRHQRRMPSRSWGAGRSKWLGEQELRPARPPARIRRPPPRARPRPSHRRPRPQAHHRRVTDDVSGATLAEERKVPSSRENAACPAGPGPGGSP